MLRTFKYRLYPNNSQQESIKDTTDACRFVYNWALEKSSTAYKSDRKSLSAYDLNVMLPELKEAHPWLAAANSQSLQQAVRREQKALQHFFRRVKQGTEKPGYPKFRSKKHHRQSFDIPQNVRVDIDRKRAYLPKIGWVMTVFHRGFKGNIKTCTVVSTATGKFFICIVVEDGKTPPRKKQITKKRSVGIDVGLKTYATLSNGEKIENRRFLQSSLKRIQCLDRRLSRKKKGSKNYEKARITRAKYYEKIANQRVDFQHKLSTRMIHENQGVFVESLNVSGMRKNRRLSRAISDAAWSSFLSMLKYKAEWNGVTLIELGRFEPSTKLCHKCGFKNNELTLNDRDWTCPQCNEHHDRDINAAINIKMIGLRVHHTPEGLGEGPVELPTLVGAKKQETQRFGGG